MASAARKLQVLQTNNGNQQDPAGSTVGEKISFKLKLSLRCQVVAVRVDFIGYAL